MKRDMDSNLVAIVSVVMSGLVSPVIAAIAARSQVVYRERATLSSETRKVLDEAINALARTSRANGHCIALWRRGVPDNTDEAREQLAGRRRAGEDVLASHGRLCIRFGPESDVTTTYWKINKCIDELDEFFQGYRQGGTFPAEGQATGELLMRDLAAAADGFLAAARTDLSRRRLRVR
jgi:hypothetical protein